MIVSILVRRLVTAVSVQAVVHSIQQAGCTGPICTGWIGLEVRSAGELALSIGYEVASWPMRLRTVSSAVARAMAMSVSRETSCEVV